MRAGQQHLEEEMLTKMEINEEIMIAKMNTHQERMYSWLDILESYQEKMAAMEEIKSKLEHQEVTKEEGTVETLGALKKRHGDWHVAIAHHDQPKKRTLCNGGSGRSWLPPMEGWPTVPFLHSVRDTVVRDKSRTRLPRT
jgi:hypothetical protein